MSEIIEYNEPKNPLLARLSGELRGSAGRWKHFVDLQRERFGWKFSYRQSSRRCHQWFDENDRHQLPAESLEDAVVILGNADFLDGLLALELRLRKRRPVKVSAVRRRAVG